MVLLNVIYICSKMLSEDPVPGVFLLPSTKSLLGEKYSHALFPLEFFMIFIIFSDTYTCSYVE